MRKHFLLLMLMALLPLAGWAQIDLTNATAGAAARTYGDAADLVIEVRLDGAVDASKYTVDDKFYTSDALTEVVKVGNAIATKEKLPAGTHYIKITGKEELGYTGTKAIELVVKPAPLTVTVTMDPADPSKVYDGTTANPTGVSVASFVGDGYKNGETNAVVTGTLTWSYSNANVGNQPIKFGGLSAKNYEITYAPKTIEITPKSLVAGMVTAANFTKPYKGAAYTPATDLRVTVKDGTKTLTAGTDFAVKVYNEAAMENEIPSPKNAGTYYVGVVGVASTNYMGGPIAVGTLTISKANLTVLANDQEMDYDGATTVAAGFDASKFQFIGLVGEDTGANIDGTKTIAISPAADAAKTVAGVYTIAPARETFINANYNIFVQNGTFTIKKVNLTIKADNKNMTVGGVEPAYTATITGAVAGEETDMRDASKGKVMVTRKAGDTNTLGEHKGVLEVSYADADVFKNYNITATNGDLTIGGGTIVVTVKPQTIEYGDAETWSTPQIGRDYFVNGLAEGDELAVTLTRANADTKTPGTYAIEASAEKPAGYTAINFVNSTLTIVAKELQVTALDQTLAVGQAVDGLDLSKIEFAAGHGLAFGDKAEEILKLKFSSTVETGLSGGKLVAGQVGDQANGIEVALKDGITKYSLVATAGKLTVSNALKLNRPAKAAYTADPSVDDAAAVIASANGKTVAVTFGDFAMKGEKWYPIVLPFATSVKEVSEAFGYAIVNILKKDNTDATKIAFKLHMGDIPANEPFVVKIYKEKNMNTVNFANKKIVKNDAPEVKDASGVKFIGSYSAKTDGFKDNEAYFSVAADKNDYYWGSATNKTYMAPLAAYFQIPAGSAARIIEFEEADGTVTAIEVVKAEVNDGNAVKNVQEGWYTLQGVKLDSAPTQKGIYIYNGKKVAVQ